MTTFRSANPSGGPPSRDDELSCFRYLDWWVESPRRAAGIVN
jgi:hypothetical protein